MNYNTMDYYDIAGERYYEVEVKQRGKKTERFLDYGDLETIVGMFECTIENLGIEDASKASATISYQGIDLVHADDCSGIDNFELLDSVRTMAELLLG